MRCLRMSLMASMLWANSVLAQTPADSTSMGHPSHGSLKGAVALPDSGTGFIHNPKRPYEARFGTAELVDAIVRSAAVVDHDMPGSTLVVNDIGLIEGGPIAHHGSHQAGRDADILFFVTDKRRQPVPSVGITIEPDGAGWDFKDLVDPKDDVRLYLDAKRTWCFVRALIETAGPQLQRIFIVEHVRSMLLTEAQRSKAPKWIRERFEALTCQPSSPHDDHMHVRFFCAADDIAQGCTDRAPMYPWWRAALKKLSVSPVIDMRAATPDERDARDARTTSEEEAVQAMGNMHARVRQFLERRKAWVATPHPGRPFCK
jgi:penicillin-insensitive murein DD-endopeptidase